MFTGIVDKAAPLLDQSSTQDALKLQIATGYSDLTLGESIAVNGVCLTVTEFSKQGDAFFFVSPETLTRTNLGSLSKGCRLNLERALTLQSRLAGHWVQGHVDGKAQLLEIIPGTESFLLRFQIPVELSRYCVEKGSITLNGISLTINTVSDLSLKEGVSSRSVKAENPILEVMIIPHTWSLTNLSALKAGDWVNVEVDILAKYVERLWQR